MIRMKWLAAPALVALAACAPKAETPEQMQARMDQESAAFAAAIDSAAAKMREFVTACNADSMASLYTETAVMLPANEPVVMGRDSIRAKFAQYCSWGSWTWTPTTQATVANGPIGIERGSYTLVFTPGPNAPRGMTAMADTGKYLLHWHKVGDRWMIADDIGNSDRPAAPPPSRR